MSLIIVADNFETKYAYAACAAPLFGFSGPCFDSFMISHEPLTEKSIMEDLTTNIEINYDSWQVSNRDWPQYDRELKLPAIICTEFVADGFIQYRMAKWQDATTISSFEDHRNDFLCDKWLPPIVFEYKILWDKSYYSPNGTGILKVIDNEMNLDNIIMDVFEVHVWSDTDHKGIQLTVIETDMNTGIFTGKVFFTTEYESSGARLLVEDAVHAKYKKLHKFSKISLEDPSIENEFVADYKNTGNPSECWYQDDDGNIVPCKLGSDSFDMAIGMFVVVFWPYIILGIIIAMIFVIWRKRK